MSRTQSVPTKEYVIPQPGFARAIRDLKAQRAVYTMNIHDSRNTHIIKQTRKVFFIIIYININRKIYFQQPKMVSVLLFNAPPIAVPPSSTILLNGVLTQCEGLRCY